MPCLNSFNMSSVQ